MSKDKEINENEINSEIESAEKEPEKIEVYAEIAESEAEDIDDIKGAALAYARYLKEQGLKPGDATFADDEDLGLGAAEKAEAEADAVAEEAATEQAEAVTAEAVAAEAATEESEKPKEEKEKKRSFSLRRYPKNIKIRPFSKVSKGVGFLSAALDLKDKVQDAIDGQTLSMGRGFAIATHEMAATYRNSRRTIAVAMLGVCVAAAAILIVFDRYTVYEYAYNGKVLGYVKEQEEVSDVLEIAGRKLTENSHSSLQIEFVPNQNVTFNLVDSSNKSLDDADIAVNKLVYMTDIETEAYGIFEDGQLVTVVRNQEEADRLINRALSALSIPDSGMEVVSAEYDKVMETRPLNVLLTSIKDANSAIKQMIEGGDMEVYHIVEDGESIESLMSDYSVEAEDIYNESNSEVVQELVIGDKVCIHKSVEPVSVTMVEEGRLREVIEFKTVKKETDKYYKGDTVIEQEGRNGIQIFEGSITKKSGEVVDRKEVSSEVVTPVQDKIILVGTAERPKSAPTGTYAMPIRDRFTYSSPFGSRWGRLHAGVDLACPTGTPIYASDGGTIIRSSVFSGYGNCIEIDHGGGKMTRYAHCSKLLVNVGEKVYQGQLIGLVGNTGNSYGSHLHFEIRINGDPIDPAPKIGL